MSEEKAEEEINEGHAVVIISIDNQNKKFDWTVKGKINPIDLARIMVECVKKTLSSIKLTESEPKPKIILPTMRIN